jgi:hypothetical protein
MLFSGFLWFLLMLVPLVFLQRLLHREIQAVLLILTRNVKLTIGLFSVFFFPGVALHELSHFLMAKLLRVRTGRVSLFPKALPNGRLQMGYVETAQTDVFRDSLIGLAPLIAGSLFVAYVGNRLELNPLLDYLRNGQLDNFFNGLKNLPTANDFYVWLYLAFAVSSTMLPSESDGHAWLPFGIWVVGLFALAAFAGAGSWMLTNLTPPLNIFLNAVATLFGASVILHVVFLLPTYIAHRFVSKITGVDVRS